MHEAIEAVETQARATIVYQVHKSIGLSVLVLSLLRLLLRLLLAAPPPLSSGPTWQTLTAKFTHALFYGLMLGIPLSGWLMVSAQWRDGAPLVVPTLWFGLFEVPHLFGLATADAAVRAQVYEISIGSHELLATATLLLLALHVAAALKHQFVDRDGLLLRMSPVPEKTASSLRHWGLWSGLAVLILAAAGITFQALAPPAAGPADTDTADIVATPGSWPVVATESAIAFNGTHAGTPFNGRFTRWRSNILLNSVQMENSRIEVTVFTDSATDGVKLHDDTLPGKEWFNVVQYPTAVYRSDSIKKLEGNRYAVSGTLTIKDRPIQVDNLILILGGSEAQISGSAIVSRSEANLGMDSDPSGRWVSSEIQVDVVAKLRAP